MSDAQGLLREPWAQFARQRAAGKVGMWIFIASETLFFGALILTYSVNRVANIAAFTAAGRETDIWYGTINTVILLTSSLTVAMAAQASSERLGMRRLMLCCLGATVALGLAFLVVKGFEYAEDIEKHLVPGPNFALPQAAAQSFFALYWTMTGVHAIHLTIGLALISRLIWIGWRRKAELDDNPQLEITALYWHLVDLVWIFLYPLFYLVGRNT